MGRTVTFAPRRPLALGTDVLELAHGGGGRASRRLLEGLVLPATGADPTTPAHDAALVTWPEGATLAFTTDTSVVRPWFFPGGDLGRLAVIGAVNDLACAGARPVALSLALVLEEGLAVSELERLLASAEGAAREVGARIVTGDTKVVERGKGDGIYATVAALGAVRAGLRIGPGELRAGDRVIVSGDVGRHGVAILSVREGLAFETTLESDCAPVTGLVMDALEAGVVPACLRDPTRGGLSAVLNEWAADGGVGIEIDEAAVPVHRGVAAACELLGLDAWSMACEGRLVAAVRDDDAEKLLSVWRGREEGRGAVEIGRVVEGKGVVGRTRMGTKRIVEWGNGEGLPRIC